LTNDWESLRDEMMAKEDEWKMEEEVGIAFFCAFFFVWRGTGSSTNDVP